jgi:rod shape-determining protein MreD
MRWFRFAVLILAATIVQKGMLARFGFKPDLLLVLLVFFAVHCSTSDAIISSFAIGLAADLIGSPMPMGPHTIGFGVCGTVLAYLHRVVAIRKMPHQALAIFAAALLAGALTHLLAVLIQSEPLAPNIYSVLFWTSVCSSIVGPLLFMPLAWCMNMKTNRLRRR